MSTSFYVAKNNASGHLTSSITSGGTLVPLVAGEGAAFPLTFPFPLTIDNEIMKATGSTTVDTFIVTRAQETTSAASHAAGADVRLNITAKFMTDFVTAVNFMEAFVHNAGTFAVGDVFFADTTTTTKRLAIGGTAQVLKGSTAGTPQWADATWAASIVENEVPSGTVNGTNTAFTTANYFSPNSLKVYRNGIRLKGGGADYTASTAGTSFTTVSAPAASSVLLVDYEKNVDFGNIGTNSFVVDEAPTGTVNGTNVTFVISKGSYVPSSLQVSLNGQLQTHGSDFTETTPSSGTFTMVTAPSAGDFLRASYQFNSNAAGNADTVDGFHANGTAAVSTLLPLNSSGLYPAAVLTAETAVLDLATSPTVTSVSYVDVTGATMNFTPAGSGNRKVRVCMVARISHSSTNTPVMKLVLDGSDVATGIDPVSVTIPTGGYEATVTQSAIVTVSAGTAHTLKLQGKVGGGTTTYIYVHLESQVIGT